MKVLVTGAAGQLGTDVVSIFREAGHTVIACDRNTFDITDLSACFIALNQHKPVAIIHCAAYTAVDLAEQEVDAAYTVNAVGTRNMVLASERVGAKFCYISTDYVFDGLADGPYHEHDNTNPQTIYGKSKRAGENMVLSLSSRYFIVRTSWLYGLYGKNFVKTMLHHAEGRSEIKVVNDQYGSPTYTPDLAKFLVELIQTEKYGIYHVSNTETCTWYEFAEAIIFEARSITGNSYQIKIHPCTTEEYPLPAPRPRNSVMEHLSIRINGLSDLRSWREGLHEFLWKYLSD